jgi:hypothetical protein
MAERPEDDVIRHKAVAALVADRCRFAERDVGARAASDRREAAMLANLR